MVRVASECGGIDEDVTVLLSGHILPRLEVLRSETEISFVRFAAYKIYHVSYATTRQLLGRRLAI